MGLPEENLNEAARLRSSRSGKLSHLTRRMNIVNTLMNDETSFNEVKSNMVMFNNMLEEYKSLHDSYQEMLEEEDRNEDTKSWYAPRLEPITTFLANVTRWIDSIENRLHEVTVSYTGLENSPDISVRPTEEDRLSLRSTSSVSSTTSVRICAEADREALLVKAAALQKKHALEDEQDELRKEEDELRKRKELSRKRMEAHDLQAELSATTAKINYLRNAEAQAVDTTFNAFNHTEFNAMNSYYEENIERISEPIAEQTVRNTRPKDGVHVQFPVLTTTARTPRIPRIPRMPSLSPSFSTARPVHDQSHALQNMSLESFSVPQGGQVPDNLTKILEKQNQLTSLLVKQQLLHTLPKGDLAVFDGNILQYNSFIHSFEHIIESRTDNNQDRLQFLIQYTKGQAQQLVKSCQFMDANRGYIKARQLLKEHFGNAYRISCAYIEKALAWPVIKLEEPRALQDFALFLRSCCNAMEQLQYMEELDTISNMRKIIFILPYKLRERWRSKACEIQQRDIRVRMADLVSFIEKQASIVSDPVFGDIQEPSSSRVTSRPPVKPHLTGSFATQVDVKPIQRTSEETMTRDQPRANQNMVPDKACLFCNGKHELMTCVQFDSRPHEEKIEFVMQNGVCFGCLAKAGHISKDCGKRLQCTICNKQHPSALHIKETTLKSLQVSVKADEHTGAGNVQNCTLSIVPVQVKSTRGSTIINTYAFLDPGSSATFCTENLLNKLNIRGKRTNILLRTMNQEQSVITYMANGIEVSALNENNFIALPEVYTQKSMPVDTDSILKTEELARWPYLSEIQIPKIKAEVELLIGNNAPKAIEPWEIINSRENGPYAVKTLLGWVVNGPLDDSVVTDSSGHQKVTVNRTSVAKLEDLIVQQYNHEFNEKLDDKEMSIEDKRLIKIAEQCLIGLKRKLKRNETFRNEYTEFMEDVISNGHAEVVPQAELEREDGKSLETENEAVDRVRDLTCVCHKGGFHLTKWVSNSRTVLSHIPKEDRATEMKELHLDRDKLPTERAHPAFPPGLFQKSDTYIRWRWKQVQFLADLFWKRWTKEYLPLLQERQKWTTVRKGYQVDDIVMVVDSSAPRGSWNLGRIIEVKPDSRGLMRTVKIITKTGVFERPITKLCLLLEGAEKMTTKSSARDK